MKSQIDEDISKNLRKRMLTMQMDQIKKELGGQKDDKETLITQFRAAVEGKTLPEEASKVFESELAKLQTLDPASSEANVCRTYLDWLSVLPWGAGTEDSRDIDRAEQI